MSYTMPNQDEPDSLVDKVEYYRKILDAIPEYWPLTRESQQWWGIGEAAKTFGLSSHALRETYNAGYLPGARPEGGSRGLQIPRSALIIHLGRLATGWYDQDQSQRSG
jgi:hypothetical protein